MAGTLLLVEDEDELRETMREALEFNGYTVVAACDGQQALEELDRIGSQVCVIFLDLVMPRMNGWDFFARMRERTELAKVPVVVHTSSPAEAPAGASRVLKKPVPLELLLAVAEAYCAPRDPSAVP